MTDCKKRERSRQSSGRGILYLLAAAILFSGMALSVKLAGTHLPSSMIVLFRGLFLFVVTLAWLRARKLPPLGHNKKLLLLRGVLGSLGLLCFFYAVTNLPLAEVTVLFSLNPVFVAIFAAIFLRERIRPILVVTLVMSIIGVGFVARPGGGALDPLGVAITLLGSVFAAGAYTTIRALRKSEEALVVVFYFAVLSICSALPFVAREFVMPSGIAWLWLLGVGICTQLAQVALTKGLALVAAGPGTAVGYVKIALAALWGWLFFSESPPLTTFLGAAFIVGGLLVNIWSQTRNNTGGSARDLPQKA